MFNKKKLKEEIREEVRKEFAKNLEYYKNHYRRERLWRYEFELKFNQVKHENNKLRSQLRGSPKENLLLVTKRKGKVIKDKPEVVEVFNPKTDSVVTITTDSEKIINVESKCSRCGKFHK